MNDRNLSTQFVRRRFAVWVAVCALGQALAAHRASALVTPNAVFVSESVPSTMTAGTGVLVSITMKNSGNSTWRSSDGYSLGSATGSTWGITQVNLASTDAIAPGSTKTFSFKVTVPGSPGNDAFQWRMQRSATPFGADSPLLSITVTAGTTQNDAVFVSQSVPPTTAPGATATVSVTMKNTGKTTWNLSQGDALGSTTGNTWGITQVSLGQREAVLPGRSKTFSFRITAPGASAFYDFQWRMNQRSAFFGAASPLLSIQVGSGTPTNGATFVSQSVPASMVAGSQVAVSVTMKNTGSTTWVDGNPYYRLGSENPQSNTTWGSSREFLNAGEQIAPGQSKTFMFTVTVPSTAGKYDFQWQMVQDLVEWFGDFTPDVSVMVFTPAPAVWPQFNFDAQHSGYNPFETALGANNVSGLTQLFQATLPSIADGAPAFLPGVATPQGTKDLLFLTTKAGHILAVDAHSGTLVWSHQYGPGTCKVNNGSNACYTTSSPAIDPNLLFVYSYGLDGAVHKYAVGDGTETATGGWPETTTLKGFDEKGSSALSVGTSSSTSYLWATNGGYPGDQGDYQGHVTAIRLSDGAQNVFNANCGDQTVHFVHSPGSPDCYAPNSTSTLVQSAIWAREGVVYEPHLDRIFMATGNGPFDGGNVSAPNHDWGDTVFSLHPDGTGSAGRPLDTYTPTNFQQLNSGDLDLGSTAPALLPSSYAGGILAVQSGKDADLRLINLSNLSGQGGPGHVGGELQLLAVPQGGAVFSSPAVWQNPVDGSTWCFVATGNGISALKLIFTNGVPSLSTQWTKTPGGTSPILANGVLYVASSSNLRALNPSTGAPIWSTGQIGGIHWESPIVINGILYCTDESSHLTAFALP